MRDNCGGQESEISLPAVRIEFIPPSSTAKYQLLDLGLIAHSKIRYHHILLRVTMEFLLDKFSSQTQTLSNSQQGLYGIKIRYLPTAGDAMSMYDEAWSHTARLTVIKCWTKIQCLGPERIIDLDIAIRNLTRSSLVGSTELTDPVSLSDAQQFSSDLATVQALDISEAQVK